jgi:metal-sulfur cluster biosynthetic enzyme
MTDSELPTPDTTAESADAAEPGEVATSGDATSPSTGLTEDQVKLALRKVKDPELNLNIVDLGLIYGIAVTDGNVAIDMSLTSPGCPSGPEIMGQADEAIKKLEGVGNVAVNLVWSPPWSPERIEPRVRAYLGF